MQDRLDIIEADIAGMAGPDQSMSLLATVTVIYQDDGADQLLDLEKNPQWGGIRKKFVQSMPSKSAMEHWEKYLELYRDSTRTYRDFRLATAYYIKNREAMDDGCVVSWDKRFKRQTREVEGVEIEVGEVSAIQHALNWYLLKPNAFNSELQNDPTQAGLTNRAWLTAKQLDEHRRNSLVRGVVPEVSRETVGLFAHIDVHDDIQYWAVAAIHEDGSANIIDYGTYPEQRRRYFAKNDKGLRSCAQIHKGLGVDGAVRAGVKAAAEMLLSRHYAGETGNTYQIKKLGMDNGHSKQIINSIALELDRDPAYRGRVVMTKGFGVRAQDTPIAERVKKPGSKFGNHCYQPPRKNPKLEGVELFIDTNYWKTQANDRWATVDGEHGALRIFRYDDHKNKLADHQNFTEHQTAETATEVSAKGRVIMEFQKQPRDNHWYDNVVDVLAVASFSGCDIPANVAPTIDRPKRQRAAVTYL